jgi:hypothetical protein
MRLSVVAMAMALAGVLAGCAAAPPAATDELATGNRGDSHTLTARDLAPGGARNLLDAVRDLRPRWLQTPGTPFATITVFIGDNRAGSAGSLDGLGTLAVREVRYFETSAAQQRFSGVSGPVIQVFLK